MKARGLEFAVFTSPEVAGEPPLVCINGGMLYAHNILWPALAPLSMNRQLVFYDQRGRGESEEPADSNTSRIEHDAEDVPALREALGHRSWDVLGHSWGGGIAMLAAERDRQGTRRLVLVGAVGASSRWLLALHAAALRRLGATERAVLQRFDPASLGLPDPAIHSAYSRAMYPAWFADQELARQFAPPRSDSRTGAAAVARLRRDGYDWTRLVGSVIADVLVIHGERDLISPAFPRELVALIAKSRLELLADVGHMPFWEAPEAFFAIVDSFLRSA